jgi:hypothetical protein
VRRRGVLRFFLIPAVVGDFLAFPHTDHVFAAEAPNPFM